MTISQKIKMALAYKGMSEAELARAVGSSPQAFNQRMKTGKFSSDEMKRLEGFGEIKNPTEKFRRKICLAGVVGFEPTDVGVRIQCLTTWLYPNI